jgi:hypothetical protein
MAPRNLPAAPSSFLPELPRTAISGRPEWPAARRVAESAVYPLTYPRQFYILPSGFGWLHRIKTVADDLGVQFFTDAKAQYESAGKWRWVVVALLAYLHLGLVVPFAAGTRDKAAVDRQLADNRAAEEALKPVLDAADTLAKRVNEATVRVEADLKADLVERFQRLSKLMEALSALDPTQAGGPEGEALFGPPPQQQMQQQQAVAEDPSALAPMSAELRQRIAETARKIGSRELPPELQAYIASGLVEPAFLHANQAWTTSGVAIARDGAATIATDIDKARAAAPAAAAELDRLAKSVAALGSEAQRLTFAPPANSTWWRTVSGKQTTILSMTADLAERVGDFNTSQMALQRLSTQIADIVNQNQQAATTLNGTLAELDKRAADLQSQLGEIGGPLKVISFKLAEIAPLMPLIIAVALAAIAAWTADGLRRMVLAAELVGGESDSTTIRRWLHAAAGGSRARVAAMEFAVAVAAVIWVALAARSVAHLPPPFLTQPILALIAFAAVVAARAYRWRSADQAVSA